MERAERDRVSPSTLPGAATSVVICAYTDRRWNILQEALASVLRQEAASYEVIVVVDHSEALLHRLQEAWPQLRVVPNEDRAGLSGARNTGLRQAHGRVVVFLDDDAVARPGWLNALIEPYADDRVLGTAGVARPRWEARQPRWFPDEFLWVVGCSYLGLPERSAAIRNPIGANMSFLRDACRRAGGFTHGLGRIGTTPLGCEETELAIRLQSADPGAVILHVPDAAVDHVVPLERTRWSYFVSRCWSEGLSKAVVSNRVGSSAGLSSERRYVTRALPSGVMSALTQAARGDAFALGRAGAILADLTITTAGYLRGRFSSAPLRDPVPETD